MVRLQIMEDKMKKSTKTKLLRTALMMTAFLIAVAGGQDVAAEEDGWRFQYKVGDGLKMGDGNNQIHLQGRVQGRFTYNALEAAADNDTWAVQRGKIKIEGFTLEKKLKFGFQMNLATRNRATTTAVCRDTGGTATANCPGGTANAVTTESTTGLATLEDYYVDYVPYDFFGIKIGQYKVPFLMQELTSSGKQQFVDRSLSTGHFNLARDLGVTLHGDLWDGGLNYAVFAMNGDGINTINRNQSLMAGLRLELPILGEYKTSESDVDDSQEHNLGIGVAYAFNELGSSFVNGTVAAGTKLSLGTMDVGYKYKGFSFQGAGMIARAHDTAKATHWGYNAQAGYFIVPKHFEVALRGAGTVFSNAIANQYEYAIALNYFIKGHGIKIQTDYGLLLNTRGLNLNDHRVRSQVQVIF
jgi:hypothetical protein